MVQHGKTSTKVGRNIAENAKNIRLGFETDGFDPFGHMSNSYSMWPIFVVVYYMVPWLFMKESH